MICREVGECGKNQSQVKENEANRKRRQLLTPGEKKKSYKKGNAITEAHLPQQ